jgi:hypothetical protein
MQKYCKTGISTKDVQTTFLIKKSPDFSGLIFSGVMVIFFGFIVRTPVAFLMGIYVDYPFRILD